MISCGSGSGVFGGGDNETTNDHNINIFSGGFNSDRDFGDDFDGDSDNTGKRDDDVLEGGRRR